MSQSDSGPKRRPRESNAPEFQLDPQEFRSQPPPPPEQRVPSAVGFNADQAASSDGSHPPSGKVRRQAPGFDQERASFPASQPQRKPPPGSPSGFDPNRAPFPAAETQGGAGENPRAGGARAAQAPASGRRSGSSPSMDGKFAQHQRVYPQLGHASPRMYATERRQTLFGQSEEFKGVYNSRVLASDKSTKRTAENSGPPLVVNPDQGADFATPPGSPSRHDTTLRTAVRDYDPAKDMLVNLGQDQAHGRQSTHDTYMHQVPGQPELDKPGQLAKGDRDQMRAQATLTNDYIASQGGSVIPSAADRDVDREASNLQRRSHTADKGGKVFSGDSTTFGHVPDKPLTNPRQAPSQMGVLPLSAAANNVTGFDAGLGGFVRGSRPVERMLVREADGRNYHYRSGQSQAGQRGGPGQQSDADVAKPVAHTSGVKPESKPEQHATQTSGQHAGQPQAGSNASSSHSSGSQGSP